MVKEPIKVSSFRNDKFNFSWSLKNESMNNKALEFKPLASHFDTFSNSGVLFNKINKLRLYKQSQKNNQNQ